MLAEKQTGLQVKCLRSDGGGEYFSIEFTTYLKMHGIQRQFTCRSTPQQNGVAERKNMHIAEVARALMADKNMPHHYWAEAVATTVYIMNRTPTFSSAWYDSRGEVQWQKTRFVTLESVWVHCICTCTR
jgi:transposase InsO family protein